MTDREGLEGAGRRPDWRTRLSGLAYLFVILSLLALAVIPVVVLRVVTGAIEENGRTFEPARRGVRDLRYLFEHEVAQFRAFLLTRDRRYLEGYREARRMEEATYATIEPLVRRIGTEATERLHAVRGYSLRSRALNDSLLAGQLTPDQYVARLPRQLALTDSTQRAAIDLAMKIDRASDAFFRQIGRAAQRQLAVALGLGVLALLAALVVGWFAGRQRLLAAALARSVQEERRSREESERRRAELERITESRNRLMRGFSHDLKNPLGAADGYLQLLEEGVAGRLTERQKESVANARRVIGAALHLIDDLLELARTEAGALDLRIEPVVVDTVLRDAAEEYRAQAEAKRLALAVETPDKLPAIESDAARIRQVVGNLLSNAVKYTDRGGVTLRASVRSGAGAPGPGRWIAIDVVDTGPGIPRDQQPLLFQEFARLESGAAKRGAGIGLAIARRIARALGGDITVDSEVGRGSTFTLWLPAEARAADLPRAAD